MVSFTSIGKFGILSIFGKYKNIAIGIISYNDDIDEKRITASNAHMRIINNLFFRNENNGQQF